MSLKEPLFIISSKVFIITYLDFLINIMHINSLQGGIFGQLDGTTPRPLHISAHSKDYADLLQIPIKEFQQIIGDEVIKINIQIKKNANKPFNGLFSGKKTYCGESSIGIRFHGCKEIGC